MRFKIDIELGNDASSDEDDVAGILATLAGKLRTRRIAWTYEGADYPSGPLHDINGNKVGEWEVTS